MLENEMQSCVLRIKGHYEKPRAIDSMLVRTNKDVNEENLGDVW